MTQTLATLEVGDELTPLRRTVTQEQITAYSEAAGDPNPIHLDEEFARSVGLPGTIAHGMLSMGVLAEAVSVWAGGVDRLASISCRFNKPLLPGQTLTCAGRVVELDEAAGTATLELEATSDSGDRVLTNGRASVRLHP